MQCKKCGSNFSRQIFIEGKQHNLQNRKYCLDCSPFKCHNTSKLDGEPRKSSCIISDINQNRECQLCGKTICRKAEKGKYCWVCSNRKGRQRKIDKVQEFVGNACWICGYDTCWAALDFHHVNPEDKLISLTTREMQFSWDRIYNELKKCILTCACCHREIHCGLISQEQVQKVWVEKWDRG